MHESKGSDRDEDLTRELWTAAQMSAVWKTSNPSISVKEVGTGCSRSVMRSRLTVQMGGGGGGGSDHR
jgi:hypothetical protein